MLPTTASPLSALARLGDTPNVRLDQMKTKMTTKVSLVGWEKGCKTISCIQLVMSSAHIGLRLAKHMIEVCLEGKQTVFEMKSKKEAEVFLAELKDLGFIGKLET